MPLSPLTRWSAVLALLALAGTFLWIEDGRGGVAMSLLGIALSLWTVAIALRVRASSAFDDRAFHRTRPGGEARAFRAVSGFLFGGAAAAAAMALVRGVVCNLGWRNNLSAVLLVLLLFSMFGAAVATGFTLAARRESARRSVPLVMLGLPAVVWLVLAESCLSPSLSGSFGASTAGLAAAAPAFLPGLVGASTMALTVSVAVAAPAYLVAWWLAAARRKWLVALALAGFAGTALPLLEHRGFVLPGSPKPLPAAQATIRRLPPQPAGTSRSSAAGGRLRSDGGRVLPFEGRLAAGGLHDDEYLAFHQLLLGTRYGGVIQGYESRGSVGWGGGPDRGILRSDSTATRSGYRRLLEHLAGRIAGRPELQLDPEDEGRGNWVDLGPKSTSIEDCTWNLDGQLMRIEDAGQFAVATGGWRRLASGGIVRVWPPFRNSYALTTRIRIVRPDRDWFRAAFAANQPMFGFAFPSEQPRVLLVDAGGKRASLPRVGQTAVAGFALGSRWEEWTIVLADFSGWNQRVAEQELAQALGSRLHAFTARPVARVQVDLPPAGDGFNR